MRRMISEKSQKAIKELSEHVAVENGNVQVGKDLEVDGNAYFSGKQVAIGGVDTLPSNFDGLLLRDDGFFTYYNKATDTYGAGIDVSDNGLLIDFTDADGVVQEANFGDVYNEVYKKYFRHSLTLTCGTTATYYIDYYSKNNLKVDSIQDLTTITGGHAFGCGSAQATYASNVWSIGGANLTAVSDDVTTLTD